MNKALAALAAAGIAATSLIAVAPTASAAGCVTSPIWTGYKAPGTVAYKAASACSDLNLTYADDQTIGNWDAYAGFYKNASGVWTIGSRGYIAIADSSYALDNFVLVSDLTPGRAFSVASASEGGDYVEITH
ncbi:hypothetical protein [Streptomyces sp. NBC_00572]|uniref:hypothetical protein n=1 Tax=Streptomyces sp. NBC_00572 TaxID=2903664 RepID=UPI002253FEDB|nr:hypothetical protein [Streptomyces sp. NBC_00572]MCX4980608.1 hypothetical protein [Streptomyces sp. NBC_00572]